VTEEVITHSAEETMRWGREFAARLHAPLLVLLTGELGSGKTTLTKGLVAGLGAASEDEVTSPTFTLVHVYGRPEPAAAKVYLLALAGFTGAVLLAAGAAISRLQRRPVVERESRPPAGVR